MAFITATAVSHSIGLEAYIRVTPIAKDINTGDTCYSVLDIQRFDISETFSLYVPH